MKKFQIFFKDTDPDTGLLSQVKKMCECEDEQSARCIQTALSLADDGDPNREYYVCEAEPKTENLIICIDSEQSELAGKFQNWCADRGVQCVVCFGTEDTRLITTTYDEWKIKYMVAIVGQSAKFDEIPNWELKMSQFEDESDFDTIYSLLY